MAIKTASRLTCTLLAASLVAACQVTVGAPDTGGRQAPRSAPAASPVTAATPGPAVSGTAATTGLAKLLVPSTPSARLTGEVRLDASYLVAAGAGNILSHNGALIVAAGGLNLIGADGASLVGPDGASLVAAGAGNVISHNGSQALAPHAPTRAYQLFDATLTAGAGAPTPATGALTPAAGALTPAAGVEIRVFTLASGEAVSLGVDAAGQAVYGVLTDALGRYDLHVPRGLAGNLLVQARLPGATDPRLAFDLVRASADETAVAVVALDEDTALTTRYLRHAFARKLRTVLDAEPGDDDALVQALLAGSKASAELGAIAKQALAAFRNRANQVGVPPTRHAEVAARVTDALLGGQDLATITLDVTNTAWKGDADEPALSAMRAILRDVREAAATKLARDGAGSFDGLDYVLEANRLRPPGSPPWRVLKGADVGEMMVDAFLTGQDAGDFQKISNAFDSLGLDYRQADRLYAAASGIGRELVTRFLADPAAQAAVDAAIVAGGER